MTRILIAAEVRLYRDGLAETLARRGSIDVVATAADGRSAVAGALAERPDVVLLDMGMADSLGTVRALVAALPGLKVIVLALREDESRVIECAEAGVAGYVALGGSLQEVVDAVESVSRGEMICSPRIAATLMRRVRALAASVAPPEPAPTRLTSREREILELIDLGLSNKEIARRLTIQLATVKNHVHNILEKLDVTGRAEAAERMRAYAYAGDLDPRPGPGSRRA